MAPMLALALSFAPEIDLFGDVRLRTRLYRAGDTHVFETDGAALDLWDYNFLLTDSQTQLALLDERADSLKKQMAEIAAREVTRATLDLRAKNDDLRDLVELKSRQLFATHALLARETAQKRAFAWGTLVLGGAVLGLSLYLAVK